MVILVFAVFCLENAVQYIIVNIFLKQVESISLKNYVLRESKCIYTIIFIIKYIAYNEVTVGSFTLALLF